MVLIGARLVTWAARFTNVRDSPFLPMVIPTDVPFAQLEVMSASGEALGPLLLQLGRVWNNGEALRLPGTHTVTLMEHATMKVGNLLGNARIEAHLVVERRLYTGPVGIHLAGFRDEQNDSLHTNEIQFDHIEPARIERGEIPGWKELAEYRNREIEPSSGKGGEPVLVDGRPLKAMLVLHYSDHIPETLDELERDKEP